MITPEKLLEAAKQLEPQLQEWRRTLHRHPEVGFDLPQKFLKSSTSFVWD